MCQVYHDITLCQVVNDCLEERRGICLTVMLEALDYLKQW